MFALKPDLKINYTISIPQQAELRRVVSLAKDEPSQDLEVCISQ